MGKTFEDSHQNILQSMLSVCLEFIGDEADGIYLHCSAENGTSSADVFFDINGSLCQTHELDRGKVVTADFSSRTFDEQLSSLLECLLNDLDQLNELYEDNGRDPPTEMRLRYDVIQGRLSVTFSYEPQFSNTDTLLPFDVFNAWYEEVKSQREIAT
ncbi:hypothetical protein [Stenotrophomonas sp. ZAC14A_NAIMI4_1]|uniref:hypothetical protein n=1 Tax=Stenotrophomonas sp. ZAC14A_NAIMI4_1 TaxID=2072412 RepID=UPI000D5412B6|nr:hypothetical protein [Stenotrophomonas sp. ZAC14A_NAIMI4_1]AWH46552.1 hypothetical protein C1926_16755 [Stenotrophomonas sp. ZAC14A_NAIMI4_1]